MNYKPENRIPWLFTDFDNIKDFPWLFPDFKKISFFPDRGNAGFGFEDENDYEYEIWLKFLSRILQN